MTQTLAEQVREIGREVAAPAADVVDREGRFPAETISALRQAGILAALVPEQQGGPGYSVLDVSEAVTALAEYCAASALILAMHSIQVASVVRHAGADTLALVVPKLLAGEMLLANATSEVGLYGNRRVSICALERSGDGYTLEKRASMVSYGEDADGIIATARPTAESRAQEQALAICLPPKLTAERLGDWNALGLRGTGSVPMLIKAELAPEQVVIDYEEVFRRTSIGTSSVLLSSVWLGIAEAAAKKTHGLVQAAARKASRHTPAPAASDVPTSAAPEPPRAAFRLAELGVILHELRAIVHEGARHFERAKDTDEVDTFSFAADLDNLKIASSTLAGEIVRQSMNLSGARAYVADNEQSLGRQLRDVTAAPLMINNDRVLAGLGQTLLIRKSL